MLNQCYSQTTFYFCVRWAYHRNENVKAWQVIQTNQHAPCRRPQPNMHKFYYFCSFNLDLYNAYTFFCCLLSYCWKELLIKKYCSRFLIKALDQWMHCQTTAMKQMSGYENHSHRLNTQSFFGIHALLSRKHCIEFDNGQDSVKKFPKIIPKKCDCSIRICFYKVTSFFFTPKRLGSIKSTFPLYTISHPLTKNEARQKQCANTLLYVVILLNRICVNVHDKGSGEGGRVNNHSVNNFLMLSLFQQF